MKPNIYSWCAAVLREVRFFPDHKAIEEELKNHYEDRCRGLCTAGYTEKEAEARALAAMGDPVEVGQMLNRVHKPWLGWLWVLSTALAVFLLLTVLWQGWHQREWGTIENEADFTPELVDYQSEGGPFSVSEENRDEYERIYWTNPGERFERAGYAFELPYMAIWKTCLPDGTPAYHLDFVMVARDRCFWNKSPAFSHFEMAGSNGQFYKDATYEGGKPGNTHGYFTYGRRNPFRHVAEFSVYIANIPGEWMDITWPYGEEFTIRLSWEEAELE